MADGERLMMDLDVRDKLAHALAGRSDDYKLVMHCLHSFPEVITSQYCQIIKSHHKHEEGLQLYVNGMVTEFKSKNKLYGDDASSMPQNIPEASGSNNSTKYSELGRFFMIPFIALGRAVVPNFVLQYLGLSDAAEAVSSVQNDAKSGVLSCTTDEDAQIGVSSHIRCENAEFCSEVRSLVVTETVERISLPYSGAVPHASSQIDGNTQDEQRKELQISSSGLSRQEKLQ